MKKYYFFLAMLLTGQAFAQNAYVNGNKLICPGDELTLFAGGDTAYTWAVASDPDSILSTNSWISLYPNEGDTVLLYTPTDTIETPVWMDPYQCDYHCYVPNFFSPNGDLFNEKFCVIIYGKETKGIRLTICKRDGKVVYDETSLDWPCWDGRHAETGEVLQAGMYVWFVSYIREDNSRPHLNGFVILGK